MGAAAFRFAQAMTAARTRPAAEAIAGRRHVDFNPLLKCTPIDRGNVPLRKRFRYQDAPGSPAGRPV